LDPASERVTIPGEVTDQIEEKIQQRDGAHQDSSVSITNAEKELLFNNTLPDNHYTVQLLITDTINDIFEFIKQYQLTNYHIYHLTEQGQKKFMLVKGNFANKEEAEKALATLPADLPKATLGIKTGAELKHIEDNE